ncbi:hypothetical protein C1752_02301 [Acaryochloris thomasi RCC1774]|uniref:Uncharacterized protein n=1 Tax=Acaryochloris thomasi RCC1774 TaxID=1764569 RepID=A0A2W1JIM0_9CYAN|nr:hypothetical protein [Acaryochloris thomasi]PZD73330.1 hypothetical protein C1752_02301 [Acaryochloris thomasi RCC1774]
MVDYKFLLLLLSTVSLTVATPHLVRGQELAQISPSGAPSAPLEAPAESSPPAEPAQQQAEMDPEQAAFLDALKLTNEQKSQFQAIQKLLQAQAKSILTPAQVQQVQKLSAAGQEPDFRTLNLSADQTAKLQEAEGLANYRFSLLLTPEQKKVLSKLISK